MRLTKRQARRRRHYRVRSKISGTAQSPRIVFTRSNRNICAQVIDDHAGRTLAAVTSLSKAKAGKSSCNRATAETLGKTLGASLKEKGIDRVVFDRGGYLYHGVVKAFADGLRSADEENHFHF